MSDRSLTRRQFLQLSAGATVGVGVAGCVASGERSSGSGPRLVTTLGDLSLPAPA